MAWPKKTSYVGVDRDDFETESITGSTHTGASQYDRRSDIMLIKYQAQRHASNVTSGASKRLRRLFSREFWQHTPSRTKAFLQDAFTDLKSLGWRHHAWRFTTIFVPLAVIAGLIVVLPIITAGKLYEVKEACRPDSGFYVGYDHFDIWAPSGFFQITLGFGQLPFSTAKIIDVGWDIVIGRGGQAVLVYLSFIVYSRALVRSMESSPVSYGTFEAVTLQCGTFTSSFKLSRDLLKNRSAQAKAAVVWIVISASFVLAFPTVVSAMSGYSANIMSYVEVEGGNMVRYSSFTPIRYIIHDADRISKSLGKNFVVSTGKDDSDKDIVRLDTLSSDRCAASYYPRLHYNETILDWSDAAEDTTCLFYWHVSEYVFNYGFLALNQTHSTFNNSLSGEIVMLGPPSLNITAIFWKQNWLQSGSDGYYDWWDYPYGHWWKTKEGAQPFHNFTDPMFTNGDVIYDLEQLNLHGRCQQEDTSYKWGFSFIILFIVILTFIVWCLGMYILWLDAFLNSRFDRAGRRMGLQRAILDLAYCMRKDMGEDVPEMLSNSELQNKIRRGLNGGRITYQMLDDQLLPLSRATELRLRWRKTNKKDWCKQKAKDEKFGIGLFIVCLGLLITAVAGTHAPLLSAVLLFYGACNALVMGRSHKSRWLVFILCLIIAIGLGPVGPYVYLDKSHYAVVWLQDDPYYALSWWYNR